VNLTEQIIKECVELYEENNNENKKDSQTEDYKYNRPLECVRRLELEDLARITAKDIWDSDAPVRDFLYRWGGMQRVLGGRRGWEAKLAEQIQANHDKLTNFRGKHLEDVELSQFETGIIECYESFKVATSQVAAAKVLHLICPDFFPMWDNAVANAVRAELRKPGKEEGKVEAFSAEHYYRFMQYIQTFTKEHDKTISESADHYKRGKLKMVDEFLMVATGRPLKLLEFVKAAESGRLSVNSGLS